MFGRVKYIPYLCIVELVTLIIMKTIELTMQEIWMATRPVVQKDKSRYSRKDKHKKKYV